MAKLNTITNEIWDRIQQRKTQHTNYEVNSTDDAQNNYISREKKIKLNILRGENFGSDAFAFIGC